MAQTLSDILARVQQDSQELSAENEQRLNEFRRATAEQENQMAQARSELNAANARGNALGAQFDTYQAEIDTSQQSLTFKLVTSLNWSVNSAPLLVKFSRSCAKASQASNIRAAMKVCPKLQKQRRFQLVKSLIVFQRRSFRK
ncbi:MAG: hypothetical protein K0U61_08740 [Alphaproteobacteria bacterium]|nr:hypothetical protein [Alphaproteobacteria bacterium]